MARRRASVEFFRKSLSIWHSISLIASVATVLFAVSARAQSPSDGLKRLESLVGEWRGTSRGQPGEGTMQRSCVRTLNDRFIECSTTVAYPPQEKNRKGEVHVDRAFFSYDKGIKKLRLRQFHVEGFVNSYVETDPLVFITTKIENIPAGWRAGETYEQTSPDSWSEKFEMAAPGQDFQLYSSSVLERLK